MRFQLQTSERPELTPRQRKAYEFIKKMILTRGYGPTVREICREMGKICPRAGWEYLHALERKGVITRDPGRSRAIKLTESNDERLTLPLVGEVGVPFSEYENEEQIDFSGLLDNHEHYCLQVKGDSLVADRVSDGDYVIARQSGRFEEGKIFVVLMGELLIKRIFKHRKKYRLEGVRSEVDPIIVDEIDIVGRVLAFVDCVE